MIWIIVGTALLVTLALMASYGIGYEQAKRSAFNDGWDAHARLVRAEAREGLRSIGWKEWEDVVRPARRHDLTDLDLERRRRNWGHR